MDEMLPHIVVLGVLLVVLLLIHRARETLNPLVTGIVGGLSKHAQVNAPAYGMAIMFGLSASLSAFYDIFSQLGKSDLNAMSWHQYMSLWAKVLNPFIVASLAYATKNQFKQANPSP
jgi:hypothetical protein